MRPKDARQYTIDERGTVRVPKDVLAQAGLEPKMRVTFSVKGKTIVVAKAEQVVNPLDGELKRNVDLDMFGKIQAQRDAERANAEKAFDKGLRDADVNDAQPPDNPFRWD